jgi:hypothetical protein
MSNEVAAHFYAALGFPHRHFFAGEGREKYSSR